MCICPEINKLTFLLKNKIITIGNQRQVVLKQAGGGGSSNSGGGGEKPRKTSVNVQVKENDRSSRRNTIDLQLKEAMGRSRANTLVKVNGEVVSGGYSSENSSASKPPTPKVSRNLSLKNVNSNGALNAITDGNRANSNQQCWYCLNSHRQFIVLKLFFIALCLIDIVHWAYMLRDDSTENPNSWRFYRRFQSFDLYYLVARMFGDIFTCVLGLGASIWTRKPILTLPCTTIQLSFLLIRAVVWIVRLLRKGVSKLSATSEDKIFVLCEFLLPFMWALLSVLIAQVLKKIRAYEQLHGYTHPPTIILTLKNDENDESVQIEIA